MTELDVPEFSYELVKRSVSMALDRGFREKELISKLFSEGYPDVLSTNMVGKGFARSMAAAECLARQRKGSIKAKALK